MGRYRGHSLGQSLSLPNTPTRKPLFPVSTKCSRSPAPDLEVPSVPLWVIPLNGLGKTELAKFYLSLCAVPHCASQNLMFESNNQFFFFSMPSRIENHWLEIQIASKQ